MVKQLAQALRKAMDRRGHSIREAAAALGVASGTVVNWSEGWVKKAPRHEHWQALADYLDIPMPVMLSWFGLLSEEEAHLLSRATGVYITSRRASVAA